MDTRTGFLTIYSPDRSEVYGEFADADWSTQNTDGGTNHVLSGKAGDGAMDAFRRLNQAGISHVAFTFDESGTAYRGDAQLLAPEAPIVRIETGVWPAKQQ